MVIDSLFTEHPEVKGVFVGGCVERGEGSSFRARAHAHMRKGGRNLGWICVRSLKRVYKTDGKSPSNTMLHELAHILTGEGHTDKFRAKLRELGGRCTLNAKKRRRRSYGKTWRKNQ